MSFLTRPQRYICLPCQIHTGRLLGRTNLSRSAQSCRRTLSTESHKLPSINSTENLENSQPRNTTKSDFESPFFQIEDGATGRQGPNHKSAREHRSINIPGTLIRKTYSGDDASPRPRHFATTTPASIELTKSQQQELNAAYKLGQKLSEGLRRLPNAKQYAAAQEGIPIDEVLKSVQSKDYSSTDQKLLNHIGTEFSGQSFGSVKNTLDLATSHRTPEKRTVINPKVKAAIAQLGVISNPPTTSPNDQYQSHASQERGSDGPGRRRRHVPLAPMVVPPQPTRKPVRAAPSPTPLKKTKTQTVDAHDLVLESVNKDSVGKLPQLSRDLGRVLFNPGVYQLQDPRSRVYNFDSDLARIMPVHDFKFEALNPYLTSSEDDQLLNLAQDKQRRYVGSSSSMTSALSQFHFLISQWRELTTSNFTRGFEETSRNFTIISRSPAAIFLRYRDGIYAVDADKEYDEPNVLMSLGKSMEKLLTLEKSEFEKWRKSNEDAPEDQPEAFHYATQGRFLLRSQLDAYDPDLPGPGYFDLKTRAVAGVRMNMKEHELGMGYQIKDRFGTWESYEREYFDMMRSTFLKYSLQVRMGFMDGVFVAYHNISRMFGFQYIPISEMDLALHGQTDPCLGDQEFRFSVQFMEEIFNLGTQEYPEQSLRLHFDTREGTQEHPKGYMHIFIEPMSEPDIKAIQETQKAQHDLFEQKLLHGEDIDPVGDTVEDLRVGDNTTKTEGERSVDEEELEGSGLPPNTLSTGPTGPGTSNANKEFLDSVLGTKAANTKPKLEKTTVMGFKLLIQNKINGRPVTRPESISSAAKWSIDYQLERMSDDVARKLYQSTKSKRSSAVKTVMNRSSNDYFIRSIRVLSEKGAEWRRKQDALDAEREPVVLYSERRSRC